MSWRQLLPEYAARAARLRVLLLAGGSSSERPCSLTTGEALLGPLERLCRSVTMLDPQEPGALVAAVGRCDFVMNVIYGHGGEDGVMQGFLETLGVPFSGPSVLGSALGMNKDIFLSVLRDWGFRTPGGVLATEVQDRDGLPRSLREASSLVLKPIDEGDSLGVQLFDSWDDLLNAVAAIHPEDLPRWMVEPYLDGPFGTIGVVDAGGELLVGDAVLFDLPDGHRFYDTALKLHTVEETATHRALPAAEAAPIAEAALRIYRRLGCKGPIRLDFIHHRGEAIYLEANTIPGFYPGSNLDLSFQSIMTFEDLLLLTLGAQTRDSGPVAASTSEPIGAQWVTA